MHIYSIPLLILGVIATYFGGKWTINSLFAKSIASFKPTDQQLKFSIKKPGEYSIGILGAGLIQNLNEANFTLKNLDTNKEVLVKELTIKPRFSKNLTLGVELMEFTIYNSGNFILTTKNIDKLKAKSSQLFIKNLISPPININNTTLLIRSSQSTIKKIGGIILLVLGVNASIWGIILTFFGESFK